MSFRFRTKHLKQKSETPGPGAYTVVPDKKQGQTFGKGRYSRRVGMLFE